MGSTTSIGLFLIRYMKYGKRLKGGGEFYEKKF
jgi:hypothetical protein